MKKRVIYRLSFALILLLLSGIIMLTVSAVSSTPQTDDTVSNEEPIIAEPGNEISDEELANFMELKQPAITAHEEFQEKLVWDDELGDYLYPDTFAGAYLDKETFKLCVALTDCSAQVKAEYDKFFSDPSVITYVEANYSYNDLLEVKEEIKSSYDNYACIGISQSKNVVRVGFSDEATIQEISNVAARSAMPVEVYYSEPAIAYTSELRGGDRLDDRTVGVCGTYNGRNAILTCGHGGTYVGQEIYFDGNPIPVTVERVQYADGKSFDFAIAIVYSDSGLTLTNKVINDVKYADGSLGSTTITGIKTGFPTEGDMCKYGATSKFGVYSILESNIEVSYETTKIGGLVSCAYTRGSRALPGDSGGPVYSGHTFYGTISGGNDTQMYFSPICGVPSAFSVKTS